MKGALVNLVVHSVNVADKVLKSLFGLSLSKICRLSSEIDFVIVSSGSILEDLLERMSLVV